MKRHRFILDVELRSGPLAVVQEEFVHQVWDVLKLRAGEEIILCDGKKMEAVAMIESRDDGGINLNVNEPVVNTAEPAHAVALYCAVLKKENFELVCQKATEAGATEIVPVVTERTVKMNLRPDRLEKIIREAAEQSGRGVVPSLGEILEFDAALKDAERFKTRWLCDPSGTAPAGSASADTAVFIGPEGGWSPSEVQAARGAGVAIINLGPRILRGETAAVIATFLAAG